MSSTGILIHIYKVADDIAVVAVMHLGIDHVLIVNVTRLITLLLSKSDLLLVLLLEQLYYGVDERNHGTAYIGGALVKKEVGYVHVKGIGKKGIGTVSLEHMKVKHTRGMLLSLMIRKGLLERHILKSILITFLRTCCC